MSIEPIIDPIAYRQRTRDYYSALGYATPYRWAHFNHVPFSPLNKSLDLCKVALITTALLISQMLVIKGPVPSTMLALNSMRSMNWTVVAMSICESRI